MGLFGKTKEVAVVQPKAETVTSDKVVEWLKAFGHATALTNDEAKAFIAMATELQLNPFKREIHVSVYKGKDGRSMSIVVGYEVYIRRAERSGLLEWWTKDIKSDGDDWMATVEIKRKDRDRPFVHRVWLSEVRQGGPLWQRMPKFMAQKTAMAQAFRLAFPVEIGELPYTADEMPANMGGKYAEEEEPIKLELKREEQIDDDVVDDAPTEVAFADIVEYINTHQADMRAKAPEYMLRAKEVKDGNSAESYAAILEEMKG